MTEFLDTRQPSRPVRRVDDVHQRGAEPAAPFAGRLPVAPGVNGPQDERAPSPSSALDRCAPSTGHAGGDRSPGRPLRVDRIPVDSLRRRSPIRRVYAPTPYRVSEQDRSMSVEVHPIAWGRAVNAASYAAQRSDARARAFLFETITTADNLDRILDRYRALTCYWDVGLTVVLNGAWTPKKQYTQSGEPTRTAATAGVSNEQQQKALTAKAASVLRTWDGPPLQIVTATWERRQRNDTGVLEQVQGSVPYTTLRRHAASNTGAMTLEATLSTIHDHVWRKMGDDDMPMPEPNPAVPGAEHGGLDEAENNPGTRDKTTLVTFGYDLTTAGTVPPITGVLKGIYAKEMELRDRIRDLGAPIYPSEPTTYYRPISNGEAVGLWQHAEGQSVGGSGQQLEGAKLVRSLQDRKKGAGGQAKGAGHQQLAFHTVRVETSAGRRNDQMVALLDGWWANGQGDGDLVREQLLTDRINGLDQCALKDGEYLKKVYKNLQGDVDDEVFRQIDPLITEYRTIAVKEACTTMRRLLHENARAAHQAKKYNLV